MHALNTIPLKMFAVSSVLLLANLTWAATAPFEYVSQTRSVKATVGWASTDTSQILTAPDFGPFIATNNVLDPPYLGTYNTGGSTTQTITSTLSDASITLGSTFNGTIPTMAGTGHCLGEVNMDLVFNVTNTIDYSMSEIINVTDGGNASSTYTRSIKLTGPGTNIDWELWSDRYINKSTWSQTGTFSPGQYHLQIILQSYRGTQSAVYSLHNTSFQLSAVPEPASASMLIVAGLSGLLLRRPGRGGGFSPNHKVR